MNFKFEGYVKKEEHGSIGFYETDNYGDKELVVESEGELLANKLLIGNLGNNKISIELTEDKICGEYILIKDPAYSFLIKEEDIENIKTYFDDEGRLIHYLDKNGDITNDFIELPFEPIASFTKVNIKIKYMGE